MRSNIFWRKAVGRGAEEEEGGGGVNMRPPKNVDVLQVGMRRWAGWGGEVDLMSTFIFSFAAKDDKRAKTSGNTLLLLLLLLSQLSCFFCFFYLHARNPIASEHSSV